VKVQGRGGSIQEEEMHDQGKPCNDTKERSGEEVLVFAHGREGKITFPCRKKDRPLPLRGLGKASKKKRSFLGKEGIRIHISFGKERRFQLEGKVGKEKEGDFLRFP